MCQKRLKREVQRLLHQRVIGGFCSPSWPDPEPSVVAWQALWGSTGGKGLAGNLEVTRGVIWIFSRDMAPNSKAMISYRPVVITPDSSPEFVALCLSRP